MPRHQHQGGPAHDMRGRNLPTQAAAWAAMLATAGTLGAEENVASVTREGVGRYVVTWDRPFVFSTGQGERSYVVHAIGSSACGAARIATVASVSGTFVRVYTRNTTATFAEVRTLYVTAFGTLR